MSGIFGVVNLGRGSVRPFDEISVKAALTYRGRDGCRGLSKESFHIIHFKSITSCHQINEYQPFHDPNSGRVAVADCRIDNREELSSKLFGRPYMKGISDIDLIERAFDRWGTKCGRYILGDYAFVVWNYRDRSLFLCRDFMGMRPLFYSCIGNHCVFSSDIHSILSCGFIDKKINTEYVDKYLKGGLYDDGEDTFYSDISRVPSSSFVMFVNNRITVSRYYDLNDCDPIRGVDDFEAIARFKQCFVESVKVRLNSLGTPGLSLSGGLDSSSVLSVAAGKLNQEVRVFSGIYPSANDTVKKQMDEGQYISKLGQEFQVEPRYIDMWKAGPFTNLDEVLTMFGQPFQNPHYNLLLKTSEAASQEGVRVMLDGFDGDSVVNHGKSYLLDLLRFGDYDQYVREARAYGERAGYGGEPYLRSSLSHHLKDSFRSQEAGLSPLQVARCLAFGVMNSELAFSDVVKNEIRKTGLVRVFLELIRSGVARFNGISEEDGTVRCKDESTAADAFRQRHIAELQDSLWQGWNEFRESLCAYHGIEIRSPFFDRRLIELSVRLSPTLKIRDGWTRYIQRQAMKGIVPEFILQRMDKANFASAFESGLNLHERKRLEQLPSVNLATGKIDRVLLQKACDSLLALEPGDRVTGADPLYVYFVAVVEAWERGVLGPDATGR